MRSLKLRPFDAVQKTVVLAVQKLRLDFSDVVVVVVVGVNDFGAHVMCLLLCLLLCLLRIAISGNRFRCSPLDGKQRDRLSTSRAFCNGWHNRRVSMVLAIS